ncbi:MAG: PD-(D/E)XK nuclease family protein, partial [Ignavibacteriaceae bacterium]
TVHQAKGLEFPVVFLFKTHESSQKTLIKSKQVSVSKKFGILTKLPLNEDFLNEYQSTPINNLYDYIEEKKRIAELKRLLYVAVTRAKDHLIISGEYDEDKQFKKDSFLGLINEGLDIDFSSENFLLTGKLDYLEHNGMEFSGVTRKLDHSIPILKSISEYSGFSLNTDKPITQKTIQVKKISPPVEKDFISATKVAVYNQCPTKYLLTYEFGFKAINDLEGSTKIQNINYDFNPQEDSIEPAADDEVPGITIPGNIKGSLQHLLLEREIKPENLDTEITNYLIKEGFDGNRLSESKDRTISEMQNYFLSDIYRELSNYKNYKNEFEVYLKENGTYLYGIMDKIIFNDEELIIVDYKTDDISIDEIQQRAENYLIQLKFYLYLAQKLFSNYKLCRLILIFIKHPDKPVVKNINYQDFSLVKREISDIIKGINHKIFFKNIKHCAICTYSDNNKKCKMISESERVFI